MAKRMPAVEPAAWSKLLTPDRLLKRWLALLLRIPGYDAVATAEACRFDTKAAQLALDFFPECLRHVEGGLAGKPFVLEPWQQAVVANLFGWKRLDEQGRIVRRYRESLIYVPRKNGKTPWMAGLALFVLFCDDEPGQQNYIAAESREQAGKLFRHARGMVSAEECLRERCRVYGGTAQAGQAKSIVKLPDESSFVQVISADADSQHGGSTHLAIIDELHTQPNRELIDVLTTSTASLNRKQPLMIYITTADYDRPSICNEKHDYACKVRDGIVEDPAFLPVVYEVAKDAPWDQEASWRQANPNLGVSVSLAYLRRECQHAKESAEFENTYRRLHLNQRTEQAVRIIPMDRWRACLRADDPGVLPGRRCHGALDIGATSDFTCWLNLFPHDDGEAVDVPVDPEKPDGPKRVLLRRSFTWRAYFWLPERPVKRDPRMVAVIDGWRRGGFVRTTPGEVVDYDQVLEDIVEIVKLYELVDIAFDRGFQGSQMGNNLQKHFGTEMVVQFPQGILSMNAPFRELLELTILGRLHHDGNPVMAWMAANTAAERRGGLMKPSKDKSTEKIDGITALTMALGRALANPGAETYTPGMMRN